MKRIQTIINYSSEDIEKDIQSEVEERAAAEMYDTITEPYIRRCRRIDLNRNLTTLSTTIVEGVCIGFCFATGNSVSRAIFLAVYLLFFAIKWAYGSFLNRCKEDADRHKREALARHVRADAPALYHQIVEGNRVLACYLSDTCAENKVCTVSVIAETDDGDIKEKTVRFHYIEKADVEEPVLDVGNLTVYHPPKSDEDGFEAF